VSNETFEEWYSKIQLLTGGVCRQAWNHQQQKLDLEIQSNTKMKEEYRQLDELYDSRVERIKELEGIIFRSNAEPILRENKSQAAQLELLTKCTGRNDFNRDFNCSIYKNYICQGCKNAADLKQCNKLRSM